MAIGMNMAPADSESPRILISVELDSLKWEVPGYQAMVKKVFFSSLLTGGLGGLAYASTKTHVHGDCSIRVTYSISGVKFHEAKYEFKHVETMAKLKCDTRETRVRVVSAALSNVIGQAIADLSTDQFRAALDSGTAGGD